MQSNNQYVLIHKILYAIMLLAGLLAALGAGNLPPARAQGNPEQTSTGAVVSLSANKGFFSAANVITLHVMLSNPTADPIRVPGWFIPAEGMTDPLFVVTRDGEQVPYLGMLIKRAAPNEQDTITLAAGESLTGVVNLADYYDLSVSGNYAVRYDVALEELHEKTDDPASRLTSNTLNLFIEGRAAQTPQAIPAQMVSGTNAFNGCSTTRQTDLINARNAASTYSTEAVAYFGANRKGERYTTWFGVYDPSRYNTVSSHFSAASNAVDTANPMNFDCTCTDPKVYAYVYPNSPYNIYLCGAFWGAPLTGTDSKAGTLIHEITHFSVVAGTQDYVYGQSGAKALAISNPDQAVMNADNHEYFAENNPPLETTPTFTISGNAGIGSATLTYTGGSTTADGSGNYSFAVVSGWSGTVTPSRTGYTFTPPSRTYTNVVSNQSGQNYTATATGSPNLLQDPSFEAYTPNPYWVEASTNYGTPLCTLTSCGNGGGSTGPRTGSVWAWFGGSTNDEAGSLSQNVVFPNGSVVLQFYFWIGSAGAGSNTSDTFNAKIDNVTVFSANATQSNSYSSYTMVSVDVSAFANGAMHKVTFDSVTTGQIVNFNLDDVALIATATATFVDVQTSYWAWSWIERLYAAHFTGGCSTDPLAYCPEKSVTRAEMAIFLERGMNSAAYTPPPATGTVFVDVPLSYWDADWIEKLYTDQITGGCLTSPLKYCPESPTTRAEMAVFLLKARHGTAYNPPAAAGIFMDVPTSYWAASWIEQLYAEEITGGCNLTPLLYCPGNSVTRAQMAVFLVKIFNLP